MKQGWTYKKLGEVCNLIGGGTPSKKNASYYNGSILWATVRDMNCDVLTSTEYSITEEGLNDSASHIVDKGEIIIATRVGLGKVCKLAQPTAINQDLKGVVPKKENINRDFLFYYFKTIAKYIESNGVGATVKGVKMKFIEELDFPIPPLSEQQRIVKRLDSAFAHIDELKANAEKQLSEARALFQKALAKAMEPKEEWEEKTLGELAVDMFRGSGIKRDQVTKEGVPCVRYGEIYTTYNLAFEDCVSHTKVEYVSSPKYFEYGDLLFAITGESVEDIGKTIAYLGHEKCLCGGDIICMKHKQNPKFLSYALSTPDAIRQKGIGKTKLKVVHTNALALKAIRIPLPCISEQQRIVSRLDSLAENVKKLEENQRKVVAECDNLKQALLRKVFE